MFRLFKKKRNLDPIEDQLNKAVQELGDKWISYTESIRSDNGVPLSENIDIFAQPLVEFFKNRYMTLYQYSESFFWYTLSEAILKSKTHPRGEVNNAIKDLNTKYN
ncbi:hypothetical protein ACFL2S_12975 [Thermodesulfobacteriota bacterium]